MIDNTLLVTGGFYDVGGGTASLRSERCSFEAHQIICQDDTVAPLSSGDV